MPDRICLNSLGASIRPRAFVTDDTPNGIAAQVVKVDLARIDRYRLLAEQKAGWNVGLYLPPNYSPAESLSVYLMWRSASASGQFEVRCRSRRLEENIEGDVAWGTWGEWVTEETKDLTGGTITQVVQTGVLVPTDPEWREGDYVEIQFERGELNGGYGYGAYGAGVGDSINSNVEIISAQPVLTRSIYHEDRPLLFMDFRDMVDPEDPYNGRFIHGGVSDYSMQDDGLRVETPGPGGNQCYFSRGSLPFDSDDILRMGMRFRAIDADFGGTDWCGFGMGLLHPDVSFWGAAMQFYLGLLDNDEIGLYTGAGARTLAGSYDVQSIRTWNDGDWHTLEFMINPVNSGGWKLWLDDEEIADGNLIFGPVASLGLGDFFFGFDDAVHHPPGTFEVEDIDVCRLA